MGNSETAIPSALNRIPAFLFPLLLALSFLQQPALPQVKDPELPVSPEIEDKSSSDHVLYPVEVSFSGGSLAGEIDFPSAGFADSGSGKYYYWKDVSSVRILSWVRCVRGKAYAFYPETYEVVLKNGEKQQVSGNIKVLNRFRLVRNRKQRTMYTYYYDDYIKGAWAATGIADFYSPVLKPAEGCVVSINFR